MRAMILAAGRGERLRPLTDTLPKPLLEVAGERLIERHLRNLAQAGIAQVVINLAWLGDMIRDHLGDGHRFGLRIHYSPEPEGALETGGGIINALGLLGNAPFLVINGDILTDFPFGSLYACEPEGLAHLVLVDNPDHHPQGDFSLTKTAGQADRLIARQPPHSLTFSGIAAYRPQFFARARPQRQALAPLLHRAIEQHAITGQHYQGLWMDIGTRARLKAAEERLAQPSKQRR